MLDDNDNKKDNNKDKDNNKNNDNEIGDGEVDVSDVI